jgi:hypothetical protein
MESLESVLDELTPVQVDPIQVTTDHRKVIKFCDRLVDESRAWRGELGLAERTQRAFDFLSSNHFLSRGEANYRARVVVNLFRSNLERKIAMLTDSVPQLDVVSRSNQFSATASMLKDVSLALWEENNMQRLFKNMVAMGSLDGSAPVTCMWDHRVRNVRFDVMKQKDVLLDRGLLHPENLQTDALYGIIRKVRPLSDFRQLYGEAGYRVRPDVGLSQYELPGDEEDDDLGSIGARPFVRPGRRGHHRHFRNSAIPYAEEFRCYFRDPSVHPIEPTMPNSSQPNFLFPRKRVIVWSRDVILYDGPNVNWDGGFPFEVFDWGLQMGHPYGDSEIDTVETMQVALNVLISGVVHNAKLANDPPWIMEQDALEPPELDKFRKWRDRPGWAWVVPKNMRFEQVNPAQMSTVVFSTIELLQKLLEQITGVTPVTQGQRPEGVTSGVALDSLLLASQYTIRLQARVAEDMLNRLGQLMISRVLQYFSDDRVLLLSNEKEIQRVLWQRGELVRELAMAGSEEEQTRMLQHLFDDFTFRIKPFSALAVAQLPKISMYERFADKGWMHPITVMEVAQVPNAEEEFEKAAQMQADQQARVQLAMMQQQQQAEMQKAQQQNGGPPAGGIPVGAPVNPPVAGPPSMGTIHSAQPLPPALQRIPPGLMGGPGLESGGTL